MRIYRWVIVKYALLGLLAALLFHLQSSPYFFTIAGIRPLLLLALAFAVAVLERELASGLFGLFCGYLADLFSYERMGYYMFFLFVLCIAAGLFIHNYLRITWPACVLVTFLGTLLCRLVLLFFRYTLPGHPGGWHWLISHELPLCLYTAVISIPLFFLVRLLHRECERHYETRL